MLPAETSGPLGGLSLVMVSTVSIVYLVQQVAGGG